MGEQHANVRERRIAEVFVELADTLVDEFDVVDFLQLLTDRCVELLEASAAGIMLSDSGEGLRLVASTSQNTQNLELFELQIDQGPCLDTFSTGEPILNVDMRTAHRSWPDFTREALSIGMRSTSALPLRLRGQVVGALNLFSDRHDILSSTSLALGQAMADIATISLINERALREQTLLSEQLQSALQSRIVIEQAKGVLAARAGITIDEAFQRLRGTARRTGTTLTAVAATLIAGGLSPADIDPSRSRPNERGRKQSTRPEGLGHRPGGVGSPLNDVDTKILSLIAAGVAIPDVAHRLDMLVSQVGYRLVIIRKHLGVTSTREAIDTANRSNLL